MAKQSEKANSYSFKQDFLLKQELHSSSILMCVVWFRIVTLTTWPLDGMGGWSSTETFEDLFTINHSWLELVNSPKKRWKTMGKSWFIWNKKHVEWKITMFDGNIDYIDWAIFKFANCESLPEGIPVSADVHAHFWKILPVGQLMSAIMTLCIEHFLPCWLYLKNNTIAEWRRLLKGLKF